MFTVCSDLYYVFDKFLYLYFLGEVSEKRSIVFEGKDKVSYSPVVTLYFDPITSNGTEDDIITFLNIPAIVHGFFYKILF